MTAGMEWIQHALRHFRMRRGSGTVTWNLWLELDLETLSTRRR